MGRYGMSYFSEIVVVHILIILSRESSGAFDLRSSSNSQSQFAIITSISGKPIYHKPSYRISKRLCSEKTLKLFLLPKEKHSISRDKLLLVYKCTPPGSEQMPPRLP